MHMNDKNNLEDSDDHLEISNEEQTDHSCEHDDLSVKEQMQFLLSAVKDSISKEVDYFKTRAGYSFTILTRALFAIVITIIFVLVAFISLGVGILLMLEPIIGATLATLCTVVIFLTLSIIMGLVVRFYFKKLSFPELTMLDKTIEKDKPNDT